MLFASAATRKLAAKRSARERMVLRKKILREIRDGWIIPFQGIGDCQRIVSSSAQKHRGGIASPSIPPERPSDQPSTSWPSRTACSPQPSSLHSTRPQGSLGACSGISDSKHAPKHHCREPDRVPGSG